MNDPKYHFSDGTEVNTLEEAKHKVNVLMEDYQNFGVEIDGKEIKFTQLGGCEGESNHKSL